MTFPAAGSATDLALLLADHHGAALIVTAGHTATIEEFFDRTRAQSNPSTFLTRLKVGPQTRRRKGGRHAVSQQDLRWRDRDARAGDAGCDHRRVVGIAAPITRCWTGSRTTGTDSCSGFKRWSARTSRDYPAPARDFARRSVLGARCRCRLGLRAAVRVSSVRIARRQAGAARPYRTTRSAEKRANRKAQRRG